MVKSPWWEMVCSEALLFCATNTSVFYSVRAFKMLWKLDFEVSVFSGEDSFLR